MRKQSFKVTVKAKIAGTKNAWSAGGDAPVNERVVECPVESEIAGSDRHGYHLIMSPRGFFTADTWHESLDEAFEEAESMFGAPRNAWTKT